MLKLLLDAKAPGSPLFSRSSFITILHSFLTLQFSVQNVPAASVTRDQTIQTARTDKQTKVCAFYSRTGVCKRFKSPCKTCIKIMNFSVYIIQYYTCIFINFWRINFQVLIDTIIRKKFHQIVPPWFWTIPKWFFSNQQNLKMVRLGLVLRRRKNSNQMNRDKRHRVPNEVGHGTKSKMWERCQSLFSFGFRF